MTFKSSMDILPELTFHMPEPLYWYSKSEQKGYIIITVWSGDANGVYSLLKYDIQGKKWHKTKSYTSFGVDPRSGGHAINIATDQVYLFGGLGNTFAKYNLVTDEWNDNEFKDCGLPNKVTNPAWCMLHPPYNQLHIYNGEGNKSHYRLNDETNKFDEVYKFTETSDPNMEKAPDKNSKMIFINNNLLLFAGDNDTTDIFQCKIKDKNQKIEWKLCDLKLPEKMSFRHGFKCIVVFNNVVIIFNFKGKKGVYIWYLDIVAIEQK